MKKILVVNLTRFGDLLQTGPTIVGLRERHPDAEIVLLAERNFAPVCRGIPGIDRVWELDLDNLGRVLLGRTATHLRQAYGMVEETVHALRAEGFDLALNYSSSKMSAVLLKLIGVRDTRGWTMTADGHRLISHPWSRLFSASCLVRHQAPFNLVDYYKRVAGVPRGPERLFFTVPDAARTRIDEFLATHGWRGETPLVAMQLGASRPVRRWPAANWIALGRELHARLGARAVLCGGAGESDFGDEIKAALGEVVIDACGATSVAELGALLARTDVLVTPDTGPMHMAVAVGTPVVSLFFGPALPFDTGPYAADQLCLHADVACAPCDHNVTCLDPFCRATITPAAVADAVVARRAADWDAIAATADRWPAVAWYRTTFDREGLADVVPLGARPIRRSERLRRVYRTFWKAVLDGTPPAPGRPVLPEEAAVARRLIALATDGVRLARAVEPLTAGRDLEALEEAVRRLEERDIELFRFGAMHEPAALLLQLFRFDKENIDGDDVRALARTSCVLHEELEARARLLADLLEPEAVSSRAPCDGGEHASVT